MKSPPTASGPTTENVRPIRSVHRALDVLETLVERGPAGLHQLHSATGLSKSTLRRLLATLVHRRFVRQGISDGMYRSNVATPRGINTELTVRIGRLVEVARPHMLALTQHVRWPSDLHIYANGRMRILESTHGLSPFGRSSGFMIDSELNLFAAASGLAFLASRHDEFALRLANELESDEFWSMSRFGLTPSRLVAELRKVRRAGFATRRVTQGRQDGSNAIAVTIVEGDCSVGALTISWRGQLMSAEEFAAQHLAALQSTARAISDALAND
jgi:IclR family transcriptional regulator, mhp operon transcriptional activator